MGNASVLTLGQRGPDARQEVPMSCDAQLFCARVILSCFHPCPSQIHLPPKKGIRLTRDTL